VPEGEDLIWQDPVPAVDHPLIDAQDIAALKAKILRRGCRSRSWSHRLGLGLDLPRQRQARRRQRRAYPPRAAEGLGGQPAGRAGEGAGALEAIKKAFNAAQTGGKKVSLADLIVLGGCAAVEAGAKKAGHDVKVPFYAGPHATPRRSRPTAESFAVLEPKQTGSATTRQGHEGRRAGDC
jgi:catalase-peroxidase